MHYAGRVEIHGTYTLNNIDSIYVKEGTRPFHLLMHWKIENDHLLGQCSTSVQIEPLF